MKTLILNISLILLFTSCLPDSLEKWDMDEPQSLTGCVNIDIQGEVVCAEAATSELVAADFNYQTIEENEDKLSLPTVVEVSDISPTFVGAPEEASYFFTSAKVETPNTWFDFSDYGLELDSTSGVISGTPTKFLPETEMMIKAYHVESGTWLTYEFKMAIATNFEVEGNMLVYPYSSSLTTQRLRLTVSDASLFDTCETTEDSCFTTDKGIKGYIDHIDEEQNLLFVQIKATDRSGKDWEYLVIQAEDMIENGNDFIVAPRLNDKT